MGNDGVILDPDVHISSKAKEGADVREVLAFRPVVDLHDLGIVRDAALVVAFVAEDSNFRNCKEELLGGDGGTSTEEAVENAMYIVGMFPDEAADLAVSRSGLVPTVLKFVARCWSFNACVI